MLMPPNEEDALSEVYYLTQETTKNWRKLLKYADNLDLEFKRKLLWIWPTEKNLWQINKLLRDKNISSILSIGCGNGLLEWLLQESLNLQVYGLEVDRQWWLSNYAIKSFIHLNYIEDMKQNAKNENYLQQCCLSKNWKFALMFCYFNNRPAFLEYLKLYEGNWIIIVGALEKRDIHTDPLPLEPKFPDDSENEWILRDSLPIGNNNVFVLYEKSLRNCIVQFNKQTD